MYNKNAVYVLYSMTTRDIKCLTQMLSVFSTGVRPQLERLHSILCLQNIAFHI